MSKQELEVAVDSLGWIKLFRKTLESDLWTTGVYDERSAWIWLLLTASYEQSQIYDQASRKVIVIEPGQMLTSIKKICERWSWSYGKVSRYLDNLEAMGMITQNRTTKYTIITITNWDKYQGAKPKNDGTEPNPEPQKNATPPTESNPNKAWEDMTEAEQAAYLRR